MNSQTNKSPKLWTICEMIMESVEHFPSGATIKDIKQYISQKWNYTDDDIIYGSILLFTVNDPLRVNYGKNISPRVAVEYYDCLYKQLDETITIHNVEDHGQWAIVEDYEKNYVMNLTDHLNDLELLEQVDFALSNEKLMDQYTKILKKREKEAVKDLNKRRSKNLNNILGNSSEFAKEKYLSQFLANNLYLIEKKIELFIDDNNRDGKEYPTDVGFIDILAFNRNTSEFVVIELKKGKTADQVIGQIQRYMGWVKTHLSKNRKVRGIIIASTIDKNLQYAALENPNITLKQYALNFTLTDVE